MEEKKEKPKEPEKKNIFEKIGTGASRSDLRKALYDTWDPNSTNIPKEERVKLEKELFSPDKYGPNISEKDVDKEIKKLNQEKSRTPHDADKIKIQHQINLLEKIKNSRS